MPHLSLSVPENDAMKKAVSLFMSGAGSPTFSSSMYDGSLHCTCCDECDGLLSLASSGHVHHTVKTHGGHFVLSKT